MGKLKRKLHEMLRGRKGNINMLIGGAIGFTVMFTTIVIGALVLAQIQANPTVNLVYPGGNESQPPSSGDANASAILDDGKVALNDLSSLAGILVFVLFLAVVVGFFAVLGYAGYRYSRR